MLKSIGLTFVTAILIISNFDLSFGCNESVCVKIVSKCMLTNSCNCSISNFDCYKQCFDCLNYQFDECCSCFDLCPKSRSPTTELGRSSEVGDFDDAVPELFEILTVTPDIYDRWTSFSLKVDGPDNAPDVKEKEFKKSLVEERTAKESHRPNCRVAFMAECTSLEKCRRSCKSIGASSYRWFHDGCCECVDRHCTHYGLKESKCLRCPFAPAAIPQQELYDDYGQETEEVEDDGYRCDRTVDICPLS